MISWKKECNYLKQIIQLFKKKITDKIFEMIKLLLY
jgi:hypothetical protein